MNKTYTELTGFTKDGNLDFDKLLNLTSLEFANEIQEQFHDVADGFFTVIEKTGINSLDVPIHQIYVSLGNHSYTHHYMFSKNAAHYNEWKVIVNQEFFENVVRPFQNNVSRTSTLSNVIGVDEASELWNLSSGYIKNLCAERKIKSKKIGKTWIIDKDQPNPSSK